MKKNALLDKDFLKALDNENQREIFVKIASLTFDEDPIEFITGRATGGSINIDGNSSTRRTCSITLAAKELNIHDFYWGLNTKFRVFIGLENNIDKEYDDIIWFNQGIFLITDFSTNQTTNNYTVSIQGRDKMSLLNGDLGGVITSLTADFGKVEEIDDEGNINIISLPLKEIITEVVHTWAREPYENIIIEDLDEVGLELLEYRGEEPMYFLVSDTTNEVSNMMMESEIPNHFYYYSVDGGITYTTNTKMSLDDDRFIYDTRTEFYDIQTHPTHIKDDQGETYTVIKCSYGETIGFRETDLTYAGELIGNVGNSIVQSCLEPIKNMLGNYEYFYDIEGRFHFQRKRIFIDVSWNNLKEDDSKEIYADSTALTSPVIYSFENANLITSFQNKPQFSNLKNDYSIWGTKTTSGNNTYPVHLRYAIDKKPTYYKNMEGIIYDENDEWREILYQMAKDYLKNDKNLHDFLYEVAQNNPNHYPTGHTGYEMYYTDIISFWREIYNPEFDFDIQLVSITKDMFDEDFENYYWFDQCEDDVAFSYDVDYFVKVGYQEYSRTYPTQAQYDLKHSKYYILRQGVQGQFDRHTDYYILITDTYNKQKYDAIIVENRNEIPTKYDNENVYYVKDENAYYCYTINYVSGSNFTFSLIKAPKDKLKTRNPEYGWHKDIIENPTNVNFWFDFLDSKDGSLSSYNVRNIGDRPKSVNDNNVKSIYYRDIPSVVFLDADLDTDEKNRQKRAKPGYAFISLPRYMAPLFTVSTQKKCSKDVLQQWLYDYTKCTESITISALPVYYLEPNTRIFIYDENSGINGEYIIDKISYQLTYNSTMNIQAVKAVDRIY